MSTVKKAAVGVAILLAGVALFQVGLAIGFPWGDMSYGGQAETVDGVLPAGYRVMSGVAVVILLFAAYVVLARAGVIDQDRIGERFLRIAVWVVFGYLLLNTVMNLTSSHAGERFGMGLVTFVAAVLSLIVARGRAGHGSGKV